MTKLLTGLTGAALFALILSGVAVYNQRQEGRTTQINVSQNETLLLGQTIYQANCASCHGENGEGYASLQNAPALNGSEHAWHHPDEQILDLIRYGGNMMPAVGADWSDEEVEAVWAYVKQWWTPQQQRAQQGDIGESF